MEANTITIKVEEEGFAASANARTMELDDENKNMIPKITMPKYAMIDDEEEGTKLATPKIEMGYNDVSNRCKEVGFAQYVHHRER